MQVSNFVVAPVYTKYSDELFAIGGTLPPDVKPVNFMDYIEQASALRSASESSIVEINDNNKIDVVSKLEAALYGDPSVRRVPSTGDAAWDKLIDLGLDYSASCFDFTNARDYRKLTDEEDFTGMSKVEIYKAIYEKYQYCYGENFLNSNAINYLCCPLGRSRYESIYNHFFEEAAEACGGYDDLRNLHKKALYGDMKDYDVRQAIIDKYVTDGNVTLSDFYKMTYEMDRCGVGEGVHGMVIRFDFETKNRYPSGDYYEREKRLNDNVSSTLLNDMTTLYGLPRERIQSGYKGVLEQIRNSLNV